VVYKRLKIEREFIATLRKVSILLHETIEIKSLVSRDQKDFKLAMASTRAALIGNASLITTFSVVSLSNLWCLGDSEDSQFANVITRY